MADWKALAKQTVVDELGRRTFSNITYATLTSLSPLTFIPEGDTNVELEGEFLVVPKYKVFTEKDIGKKFVFQCNDGGQTWFYLYEPSNPQGSNGVEYKWKGRIDECELIGTCPDGEVIVTHGTIEVAVHEEGAE